MFDRKEAYFSTPKEYKFKKDLFRHDDTDHWYNIWMDGERKQKNIELIGNRILSEVFHVLVVHEPDPVKVKSTRFILWLTGVDVLVIGILIIIGSR